MKIEVSKKWLIIIISILLLIFLAGASLFAYNQYQIKVERDKKIEAQAKKAKQMEQKQKMFKTFAETLAINGNALASSAEDMGDQYLKVWEDAIYENSGAKVDQKYYTEFSEAIAAQQEVFEKNGELSNIEEDIESVKASFKGLKDTVTSENEDTFTKAEKYYDSLMQFVNLAKTPTGSYTSYSGDYVSAKNNIISQMDSFSDLLFK
ncbi:hypothetical protein [Listeria fleischmannii]|uniref:hypothetical protein n=1 Tax=Listeria fleischmannii TaxID=1069827 RepID=UPI000254F3EE|nr:hypothetical protein [Listeria fleischmannii]EIA19605.1 hypothetical protein KKC_11551 [Listeria fleischmannii subsp. coloradonensis]MBC1419406.1 hypothetical protein [Listeria fleischmannii]STY35299.1 Uncharacterised protein [Listeria fleischmannii subsp. coloradonensis]